MNTEAKKFDQRCEHCGDTLTVVEKLDLGEFLLLICVCDSCGKGCEWLIDKGLLNSNPVFGQ